MIKINPVLSSRLWFLARLFMGVIFVYAGFSKLMEPVENFRGVITQYEVIPYQWTGLIALVIPWIEFLAGAFLILGYAVHWSALALACLSLGFVIVLTSSQVLMSSTPIACGCFGEGGIHLTVRQVFLMDIANFAFGIRLFLMKKHILSLDGWLSKP